MQGRKKIIFYKDFLIAPPYRRQHQIVLAVSCFNDIRSNKYLPNRPPKKY